MLLLANVAALYFWSYVFSNLSAVHWAYGPSLITCAISEFILVVALLCDVIRT